MPICVRILKVYNETLNIPSDTISFLNLMTLPSDRDVFCFHIRQMLQSAINISYNNI